MPSTELVSEITQLALKGLAAEGITLPEGKGPEAIRLIGSDAVCDSTSLVAFLVALEEQINDAHRTQVTLLDDRAMSQKNSPFRTVATVSEFAATLVEEARGTAS
jgi:hypothetical protein